MEVEILREAVGIPFYRHGAILPGRGMSRETYKHLLGAVEG